MFTSDNTRNAIRVYAIIDDQSNRTLATKELFDQLDIRGETFQYTLSSCSGRVTKLGRRASNLQVRSIDGKTNIVLPQVTECDEIPNEKSEIPTPEVARACPHLGHLTDHIPSLDLNINIELLIGRDLTEAHHVIDQVTGSRGLPFAQKLSLGWVIIGEVCLGRMHRPDMVNVNKIYIKMDVPL